MEVYESGIHQVFVKLLDGKHKVFNFDAPSISVSVLKHRIETLTAVPAHLQLLLRNNSNIIHDHETLTLNESPQISETLDHESNNCRFLPQDQDFSRFRFRPGKFPLVVNLLLRLRGGKGGFGSLLRGAATKAGQKKTNNFDACRDMSGRRLRHVNAEKKLEEWRAEAEERKLEKMAEEFIKKKAKEAVKSGKGKGGDSADKYVAKYREDSAKCVEEVERAVRESLKGLVNSKRKNGAESSESASKRLKIWMGKRKFADSDSEDMDEDDSDKEEDDNEKSVIIDNGNNSDSSKEVEASSGSVTGGKIDRGSSESGSEEENPVAEESLKSNKILDGCCDYSKAENRSDHVLENLEENRDHREADIEVSDEYETGKVETVVCQQPDVSASEEEGGSAAQVENGTAPEPAQQESVSASVDVQDLDKPLNFDDYNSAAELEVLGMEKLKLELQARGLKCGGTLQERAARLLLLKTTPLEMLPKKLFAKK